MSKKCLQEGMYYFWLLTHCRVFFAACIQAGTLTPKDGGKSKQNVQKVTPKAPAEQKCNTHLSPKIIPCLQLAVPGTPRVTPGFAWDRLGSLGIAGDRLGSLGSPWDGLGWLGLAWDRWGSLRIAWGPAWNRLGSLGIA